MKSIPSVSDQIDENKIFKIINKNFSKLAPSYYAIISNWLIRSYKVFGDIDKYIIVVYLINNDFIFFRRHAIVLDFDTFFKEKALEIINNLYFEKLVIFVENKDDLKKVFLLLENLSFKINLIDIKKILKKKFYCLILLKKT